MLEDADGSLLVIDTGGWYKLCCPTSQLHKPDVLGAIYRVRRKGAPRPSDPRGLTLAWSRMTADELARLLDDERPVVRRRAIQNLAEKGADAIAALSDALRSPRSAQCRLNAIWAATRIDVPAARALARACLRDENDTVRQAAIHSVSVWRDRAALSELLPLLRGESFHNRRAAAEAIGRMGDKSAVPAFLEAAGIPCDRTLEHSLTYALIEIADRQGTKTALHSDNIRTRRTALVAMDQMDAGGLRPEEVAPALVSADPVLKENAWWIASRHPEWGGALAGFLRERLEVNGLSGSEREELARHLARFSRAAPIQALVAERLRDPNASLECRRIVLRAIAQSGLKETPVAWTAALCHVLVAGNADLVAEAVSAARALPAPKVKPEELVAGLMKIGNDAGLPVTVRLNALAAVPGGLVAVPPSLFAFLRTG